MTVFDQKIYSIVNFFKRNLGLDLDLNQQQPGSGASKFGSETPTTKTAYYVQRWELLLLKSFDNAIPQSAMHALVAFPEILSERITAKRRVSRECYPQ
jgi:hypothetical protein